MEPIGENEKSVIEMVIPRDFWEHPATLAESVLVLPGAWRHYHWYNRLNNNKQHVGFQCHKRPTVTHQKWMRLKPYRGLPHYSCCLGLLFVPLSGSGSSQPACPALPVSRTSSCARSKSACSVGKVGVATCDSETLLLSWTAEGCKEHQILAEYALPSCPKNS